MATDNETTLDADLDHEDDREVSDPNLGSHEDDDAGDHDEGAELDDEQSGDDDEGDADDGLEDIEWEGKAARVPPEVKAALMRTADYTRKTQEVAESRKALEAREADLTQQAELAQEIGDERVQLALVDRQLKAMDGINWDELEEEDPKEASRLTRQLTRLREQRDEISKSVDSKTKDLTLKRQTAETTSRQQAVEDCQRTLAGKDGIKGWSPQLAEKLGEFATTRLGYTPQEVLRMTDPRMIKLIHQTYLGDQALRRERTQRKLDTQDKTAPVRGPGANSPGASRRTTDASGDKLSTAEWIRRENEREAAKRTGKR